MKRLACCLLACSLLLIPCASAASDYPVDMPYESYTYNRDDEPLTIPAPFVCKRTVTGFDLGQGEMREISDIFSDGRGRLYICDTGNNRILITDMDFQLLGTLEAFDNQGTTDSLERPTGVFVRDGIILVADSANARIVAFDRENFAMTRIFGRPEIDILEENYTYKPIKVVSDISGRMYVISEKLNQGLIQLDENGSFTSFLGAPSVVPNLVELIWRKIATKEQKKAMQQFVPTEYNSLLIDGSGFIYAASQTSETEAIVKLNSEGSNVLFSPEKFGDAIYKDKNGNPIKPYFVDVTVAEDGSYYALDSSSGKIYAYDEEGELIYAFGANGSQQGTFYSASALELVDGTLYVTDSSKGNISVFVPTVFGRNIASALLYHREGRYDQAKEMWLQVESQCSTYPLASIGLAKIDIQDGAYTRAMERLEPIHEHKYYAVAFEKWRNQFIRSNFTWILLIAVLAVLVLIFVSRFVRKLSPVRRLCGAPLYRKYRYGTYAMFHPFDGFWDIKREKRGDARCATLILVLFIVLYAIRAQFSGYVVTNTVSSEANGLLAVLAIVLPLLLWVVSNWCFTTLMSGEGSLKDIYTVTAYALKPYVVVSVPLFILSHVLTSNEAAFYHVLDTASIIWVLALLFVGMMMVHDYTPAKAVLTLLLTLVGICLIIFIALLFINIVQDVFFFGMDIYNEISFRFY